MKTASDVNATPGMAAVSPDMAAASEQWGRIALIHGYNELAKKSETLGEKVYLRLARDSVIAEYEAHGGKMTSPSIPGDPVLVLANHRCPHIIFHERDIELMRAAIRAHDARNDAIRLAAEDCARDSDNPDTCGVCHKHFAECEAHRASHEEPPAPSFPACPGARLRAALAERRKQP